MNIYIVISINIFIFALLKKNGFMIRLLSYLIILLFLSASAVWTQNSSDFFVVNVKGKITKKTENQ